MVEVVFTFLYIVVKSLPVNTLVPMATNWEPSAKVTEVKLEQLLNAYDPILVTLDGMLREVNPEPLNALFPMLVTLAGMLREVKLEQLLNAYDLIIVTDDGIVILVNISQS